MVDARVNRLQVHPLVQKVIFHHLGTTSILDLIPSGCSLICHLFSSFIYFALSLVSRNVFDPPISLDFSPFSFCAQLLLFVRHENGLCHRRKKLACWVKKKERERELFLR